MSKKLKVGDIVRIKDKNSTKIGIIKGKEIIPLDGTSRVSIEYLVKPLGTVGFNSWIKTDRKGLERIQSEDPTPKNEFVKEYDADGGWKVMLFASTNKEKQTDEHGSVKSLRIGYSIYNPNDTYSFKVGKRIAKRRASISPFCQMTSAFSGEFNYDTVNAIMDVKADYIIKNIDKFAHKEILKKLL